MSIHLSRQAGAGPPPPSPASLEIVLSTVFCSIAMYNVIELNALIWNTFTRRSGLYFWTFAIATNGILPYAIGFILLSYSAGLPSYSIMCPLVFGTVLMVSGQSMVLYSRLHLIRQETIVLRSVLVMIIVIGVLTHIPTAVFQLGTTAAPPNLETWFAVLLVWRKVEMTLFCIEESIISGLYIQAAINFFRLKASIPGNPPKKRLAMPLLVVNGFVIFLDLILLATTYATLSTIQPALRALIYSIKLKVEINLLNSLVGITRQPTISTLPDIAVTPTSTKTAGMA